ncbi:MAG: flagellar hook-associated protein FlgL [Candidatus Acidiferrales bacterium]
MSSMRANPNILPDLLAGLDTVQQQLNQADLQLASGRSINSPSDNPAGTEALVLNHAAQAQNDTFQTNIGDLQTRLQTADSALSSAVTDINQAITLGVQAGNSDLSDSQRQAIASQLQGIQQELVGIANTSYNGTYLFAGTLVETTPFALDGTAPAGVTYSGNSSVASVEIASGQSVAVNVPGDQLFLNPAGSLLGSINQLITAIQTNSGIAAANVSFGQASSQFDSARVAYGATLNQLQSTSTYLASESVQLSTQETDIAGADIAKVTTTFSQAEVAYQTLIEAEGNILNLPNLLDFIQ